MLGSIYYWDKKLLPLIFEQCSSIVCDKYNINNLDTVQFLTDFMKSKLRKEMDEQFYGLLNDRATIVIQKYITVDLDSNLDLIKSASNEFEGQYTLHWCGLLYAYIREESRMYSSEIIERFPIERAIQFYTIGHEMSLANCWNKIKNLFS